MRGEFPVITEDVESGPTWVRGHYHCKKCGGEIKCWKMFNWRVDTGVWRIGGCEKDNLIMIEYEKCDPKWIQL